MAIFVTKGSALAVVLFVLSQGLGRHKTYSVLLLRNYPHMYWDWNLWVLVQLIWFCA